MSSLEPDPTTTVLDVGFTDGERGLPGANYIEKHYPWPRQIVALGIAEPRQFRANYPDIEVVVYEGKEWPFPDKSFDIVWSNAVIEHVGTREDQVLFLREATRVGKQVFLTTPNRYFPIEVHTRLPFLHWLPKSTFDRVLVRLGKEWATGTYMRLLSVREMRTMMSEVGLDGTIVRNRMLGFTLDQVVLGRVRR